MEYVIIDDMKKNTVDKHYNLISGRYKLSAVEQKLVLSIISLVRPTDTDFMNYQIPINQFDFLINNGNGARLKKHCKDLMSKPLEIVDSEGNWKLFNWFAHIEYLKKDSMIECSISPKLKPYLLEMKNHFKSFDLKYIMNMQSEYAIRLYEILKKSQKLGYVILDLEELQDQLQVSQSLRRYDNFKRKVLQVSGLELATHSDIYFDMEEIKVGRKVKSIKFIIHSNKLNIQDNNKEFLKWVNLMRKTYVNQEIVYYEPSKANVRINSKGMLYLDNGTSIEAEKAKIFWDWAFRNQDKLITPQLKL